MNNKSGVWWLLSSVCGGVIGCLDAMSQSEDAHFVIIGLWLLSGLAFGAAEPKQAWRWAIPVGAGVCLVHLLRHVFGLPDNISPNTLPMILLLLPVGVTVALVGTSLGAFVRQSFRPASA